MFSKQKFEQNNDKVELFLLKSRKHLSCFGSQTPLASDGWGSIPTRTLSFSQALPETP